MKAIPIVRGAYVNLFSRALTAATGCDEQTDVRLFDLPVGLAEKPNSYAPLRAVLAWLRWTEIKHGIEGLAFIAGSRMQVTDFSDVLQHEILDATTLERALTRFCELAHLELSPVRFWIEHDGDAVSLCSAQESGSALVSDANLEWLQIMMPMAILRHFTGAVWQPSRVSLRMPRSPLQLAKATFSNTQVATNQAQTSIAFPASLFRLALMRSAKNRLATGALHRADDSRHQFDQQQWDFPASLRAMLSSYMEEKKPDVRLAARLSGCGVRTLQRRLQGLDLCYRDIMQEAQLVAATSLLSDSKMKVIDAAYAVGFSDPSHFTRAFRRMTGVNPSQYRKLSVTSAKTSASPQ